jgi:ubiquinone/menaquinone biosynthesis C-methylase UbiE
LPVITACLLLLLWLFILKNIFTVRKIHHYFTSLFRNKKDTASKQAYNIWANSYDSQPDNLMLALDEVVFSELIGLVKVKDAHIVDVGCGTGRHWKKIMDQSPAQLTGFDVSENMLAMLQQKFPAARTHVIQNDALQPLANNSCQLVMSTLTIAHIENAEAAITEWNRVLQAGGSMIITDYHPAALDKGAKRTFKSGNKTVSIKNYVHSIEHITAVAKQLNLSLVRLIEKTIDDNMRHYYEKQDALPVFEKWKGTPVIYGMLFKENNDTV